MAIIGASIGADGAVNACGEGCLGAFSLSPGNYLALSYPDVMSDLPLVFPMFSDTCLPKQYLHGSTYEIIIVAISNSIWKVLILQSMGSSSTKH